MRTWFFTLVFLALTFSSASLCYSQENIGAILKNDFAGAIDANRYTWVGYPTNDWGIGSMTNCIAVLPFCKTFTVERRLCPTFRCFGRANPTDVQEFLTVDSKFVTLEQGPPIEFSSTTRRTAAAKLVVPNLLQAININVGPSFSQDAELSISFGRLIKRTLVRPEMLPYIRQTLRTATDNTQREIYNMDKQRRLVIVIADVVTDSMEVTIKFIGNRGAAIQAALNDASKLGAVSKVLGGDVKLDLEVSSQGAGTYKIKSTTPLILARLVQNSRNW